MKNNKGGGGLFNFLPQKRGEGLLEGRGPILEGGGVGGFTVCSLIHGVLEKTRGSLHFFPFNVQ